VSSSSATRWPAVWQGANLADGFYIKPYLADRYSKCSAPMRRSLPLAISWTRKAEYVWNNQGSYRMAMERITGRARAVVWKIAY
jgi:hypothetical protein